MKKKSCIVCRKPLNDGIMINGRGICKSCEQRLIKIDTKTDFYSYYKNCIRRNLANSILQGEDNRCQIYRF